MADKLSVWHVDDSPTDAALVNLLIGPFVRLFQSPRAVGSSHGVDVALLDLTLEDTDGIDTVTKFSRDYPDTPFVVLTGSDDESLEESVMEAGASAFYHKGNASANGLLRSIRVAALTKQKHLEDALESISRVSKLAIAAEDILNSHQN